MEIFLLFREFVSDNIFPKDWMVMTMVQNRLDALISNGIFLYQLPIILAMYDVGLLLWSRSRLATGNN